MKLMLDLFSGLGGASEAFMDHDGWQVTRFENNPALGWVLNTKLIDVEKLIQVHPPGGLHGAFELIWASPPCREFSRGFAAPGPTAQREGRDFEPDMKLVEAAKRIIDELKPKYWVIENVIGAIPHFEELLGNPRQIIGPFVLWGNFPFISMPVNYVHLKSENDTWSSDPLRANRKALIPFEVSQALLSALESQTLLCDWI